MESLNIKYRPKDFSDVSSQSSLIKILNRQLETKTFPNAILFSGASGTGKTTIARIFANKINNGHGSPIEIDGASNNGVDNIRNIIDSATERSLDSEYKVYIIDECHMITVAGWNAFLKCIEEPPKYTIFIFCTTDPQKIPQTIINRCQVYQLSRIDNNNISARLKRICNLENLFINDDSAMYIAKLSNGSMRQAIAYLDKCKDYSNNVTLENVVSCLGNYSYDVFFSLTNAIIDNNKILISNIVEKLYVDGGDLKLFISNYLEFVLQLTKYTLLRTMTGVNLPKSLEEDVKYTTSIENSAEWFNKLLDNILLIKNAIKNDSDVKTTVEVMLYMSC